MTDAQRTYRDELVKAAGERAHAVVNLMGTEQVRVTVHRDDAVIARAIVTPAGKLIGAWDPHHLTDNIQV